MCLASVACGDNINSPAAVSVSVNGVEGSGLVLANNGVDELPVAANGTFTFATPLAYGDSYDVTVVAQPSSPTQACSVANGTGTVTSDDPIRIRVSCSTRTFTIGGTVTGLSGSGLVLQNNGGDDLAIAADGAFTFAAPVTSGTAFAVTVKTQPGGPSQTCALTNASGTVTSGDVVTVSVDCSVDRFQVGGMISGLAGTVVLQNNLGDNLPIATNGAFTFPMTVASGEAYSVSVLAQPTSPAQTCVVDAGNGTITNTDVTTVAVTCTTNSYTIGGTVVGLAGSGLALRNNGGDDLPIAADGSFTFTTPVPSGETFEVTVATQPTNLWQTCTVAGGAGSVTSADITSVTVNCATNRYSIGGSVSGIAGTGLRLALAGGPEVELSADGSYAFPTTLASGETYHVTVVAQPQQPWQTCTVSGASGSVAGSDVTTIDVTCTTNTYTIGGTVSGVAGTGVTLRNNGGDELVVAADGTFTFATPVASGQPYSVTVAAQPTSPWQTCTISSAAGMVGGGDITNVAVSCTTNTYAVGGTISGLAGTVVLQNNNGDDLTLNTNGPFTFLTRVASGSPYSVTVLAQPGTPSQSCTVSANSGTIADADVASVSITCVTNKFSIGGTVTGLAGSGLVLRNNGGDDLAIAADGSFAFATPIDSGQQYSVAVHAQPSAPTQTCVATGATGTVGGDDVTTIAINCTTNNYTVGGTLTGLEGATGLVLQNNLGDDLVASADGTFAFSTPVASGATYSVTVKSQPTSPWETCTVVNGTGTIASSDVAHVEVTCTKNSYPVEVSVAGLAGGGLVLRNNGGDDLAISGNGTFAFATSITSGSTYSVTVAAQPTSPWQTCTVASPTGTMPDGVTLAVDCVTNEYTIGGTVNMLTGSGLVLQNNGGEEISIAASGAFAFATPVASGATYAVTIKAQPSGQTCSISSASGIVAGDDVTSVVVSCATFTIAGPALPNNISGWANSGLHLTAVTTTTLTSFTFNNQQKADTIQLQDSAGNVLHSITVPAGSPAALQLSVSWQLTAGQSYRLISVDGGNGRWVDYTSWPVTGGGLRVDGTWGGGSLRTSWWFTFTNLSGN